MAKADPTKMALEDITELETFCNLIDEKVASIKKFCLQAKARIAEGVSTPSINKDLEKIAADAVAKRRARLKRA